MNQRYAKTQKTPTQEEIIAMQPIKHQRRNPKNTNAGRNRDFWVWIFAPIEIMIWVWDFEKWI